jgi:hypothetical protein
MRLCHGLRSDIFGLVMRHDLRSCHSYGLDCGLSFLSMLETVYGLGSCFMLYALCFMVYVYGLRLKA